MNTRKKFFGMNAQERDAFFASEAVKDFLQRTRDMAMQKRTVTGADLTIPTVVLELIRENIESYSKLVSRVRLRSVSGRGRQNVMGAMPEAVWTEACASLNELDFGFSQTEVDGYKVGGVIYICIATLEDSDYDLASEIITALGASVGGPAHDQPHHHHRQDRHCTVSGAGARDQGHQGQVQQRCEALGDERKHLHRPDRRGNEHQC